MHLQTNDYALQQDPALKRNSQNFYPVRTCPQV